MITFCVWLTVCFYAQWSEAVNEVQLLMDKMRMVQQLGEEFTQEEMVTRFERERTESLLEPADGMNTVVLWEVSNALPELALVSPVECKVPPGIACENIKIT